MCERFAKGAVKASDAADAWGAVLDRMEEAWGAGRGPVPPLRVYMRLGSLYNSLGRTEEVKVSASNRKIRVVLHAHVLPDTTRDSLPGTKFQAGLIQNTGGGTHENTTKMPRKLRL